MATNWLGKTSEKRASGTRVKVQIDLDAADADLMDNLIELLQLGTRAELFRSGLSALGWLAKKKWEGCTVVAITPGNRLIEPEFSFLRKLEPSVPYTAVADHPADVSEMSEPVLAGTNGL